MMKRRVLDIAALSLCLFAVAGCSDTNPAVSSLKSLKGLEFEQVNVVTASLNSLSLTAQCPFFVDEVEVSFDGGATWIAPNSHDSSASNRCSGGSFRMNVKSDMAPLSGMMIAPGSIFPVKFRAKIRSGGWVETQVGIQYSPSGSTSKELLAGSRVQQGGGFVLRGRLRSQEQKVSSGGSYKIRGRITQ